MKINRILITNVIFTVIISTLILLASKTGFFERAELSGLDVLFRLRGADAYNPNIVIIEIDDNNVSKVGRWPWKRRWHATISKALKDLGAKITYFDIIFSESSTEEDDNIFAEAIKEAGNVYLPFVFQLRPTKEPLFPIEKFSEYAVGTGFMNVNPDLDGSLKKIRLFSTNNEAFYPHIILKIAMDYLGLQLKGITNNEVILSGGDSYKDVKIPLIKGEYLYVNWLGKWAKTFKHYSFLDVLGAYNDILEGKEPSIDITPIKNSICLIAVTAVGLQDIKLTSLESEYPGIGVVATSISNILDEKYIAIPPFWIICMVVYILALIPFFFISDERPLRGILSVIFFAGAFFAIVFAFFEKNIWINFFPPLFALFTSHLSIATFHFVRLSIERQHFFKLAVTDELTGLSNIRYFTMVLRAESLMATKIGVNKKFCVIMIDVDHFKHFNDTYGHTVGDFVLKEMSNVFRISVRTSDVVARYGGEEIVVLLRNSSFEDGLVVAEKIRKQVEEHPFKDENNTYNPTISLGVAFYHQDDDEKSIIKRADDGLYKAKNGGRNRVETVEEINN